MAKLLINKHNNMLLVGKAATSYGRGEIIYSESYDDVLEQYGESSLVNAFKTAKDFGAPYVFLLNVQNDQDYFGCIDMLKQNDFTYVVFTDLLLSNTFQDTNNGGKVHSYYAYLLGSMSRYHNSTFIVTDKHASLYEDIDAFLDEMTTVQTKFLNRCSEKANLENIIFVANNLEDFDMANVPLAALLCVTDINKYPTSTNLGNAIFRIDQWDGPGDMAYFRSDSARETTVENLLNMLRAYNPEKIVFIDRILKYLQREMDFTEFKGRMYTAYQKLLFSQKLTQYLNSVKDYVIKDYEIENILVYNGTPGTVTLMSKINIQPVNCLERCSLTVEAEV